MNRIPWVKFPTSRSRIDPDDPDGPLLPAPGEVVHVEDFERILVPGLVIVAVALAATTIGRHVQASLEKEEQR